MKLHGILVIFATGTLLASAQTNQLDWPGLVESARQWALENLDESVLAVLGQVDHEKVIRLFEQLEQRFKGQYVLDLAALKETAEALLPLLESYEETLPYAIWLRTRLDYMEVSEELRRVAPAPKVEPSKPPKPLPNPAPDKSREIWAKKVSQKPLPKLAGKYVPRLKPVFAARQVPPELVWLAEVESSFDRRARSPAGARGLFQLMPDTARRFGLSLFPFDQRVQLEPSARAAASYLNYLYGLFKDWPLAVAAYNAGEGTVKKLLDRHKARSFESIASYLPAETQMYVPKVEATLLHREGVRLASLPPRPG